MHCLLISSACKAGQAGINYFVRIIYKLQEQRDDSSAWRFCSTTATNTTLQLGYPNNRPGPVNVSRPRLTFLISHLSHQVLQEIF